MIRAADPTIAVEMLESAQAAELEVVAVVIAVTPGTVVPLTTARRIHAIAPEVHLVFVVHPDGQDELRRQLALAPRIGTGWTTARDDPDTVAAAVRDAARWTIQRARSRAMLGRVGTRALATPPPMAPPPIAPPPIAPPIAPSPIETAALAVRLGLLARELRASVVPIGDAVRVLQHDGATPADRDRELTVISRQVATLSRLIDDYGDVSRLLSGTLELRHERFPVGDVITRAVASVRPGLERSGLALTTAVPAEPLWLDADPLRIEQVVTKLLDNAGRYTDRGGRIWITAAPVGGLTTTTGPAGRRVMIAVRDTGIGLTDELRRRVFELFAYPLDERAARGRGGFGLGLTLVKRLVELHGGEVDVASAGPNKGTEFQVRLPLVEHQPPPPQPPAPSVTPP